MEERHSKKFKYAELGVSQQNSRKEGRHWPKKRNWKFLFVS